MRGFGLLGLVLSLCVVATLIKLQRQSHTKQAAKSNIDAELLLERPAKAGANLDVQPEQVKKLLEQRMHDRMKALENLSRP